MQTADIVVSAEGFYTAWSLGAGASKALAVATEDGDSGYITILNPTTGRQSFTLGLRPQMHTLSTVQAYIVGRSLDNYSASQELLVHARRGGVDGATHTFTGLGTPVGAYTSGVATLPKPGGGTWAVADIMDSTLEIVAQLSAWAGGVGEFKVDYLVVRVTFTPVPKQTAQTRLRGTQEVRLYRHGQGLLEIEGPPDVMDDAEMCGFVHLSHKQFPAADGNGAGAAPWERALLVKLLEESDSMRDVTRCLFLDPRDYLTTFYEGGHTTQPANSFGDGVPRMDVGNTRTFKRDSKTWVESNDGYVDEIGDDLEKYDRMGLIFENYSENRVSHSSSKSGTTGLTLINANGGGQGAVVVDTAVLKFRSGVTPNSLKIAALSPAQASDLGYRASTAEYTAGTVGSYSIDYLNDTGGTLEVKITRDVDNWFYNPTTPGWQAGVYTISLPSSTSWERYGLEGIDVGGADTALRLFAIHLNGSTADGQIDHVAHVQFEPIPWVTSRILTDGATVIRAIESLKISNNAGKRAWHGQHGTAYVKVFTEFNAAIMNTRGGFPNWFTLVHDSDNYWKFLYDGATGNLARLEAKVAGQVYAAFAPYIPAAYATDIDGNPRGTWLTIRWTGSQGELGLAPYTLDVFVGGVKGTSVTMPGLPIEAATSDLYIGGNDVDWAANAAMRYIWFTPRVHSDTEIARRTAA